MSLLSLVLPIINQPDKTEDPKINTAFTAIQNWANGNIDSSNVKAEGLGGTSLNKGLGGAISGETIASAYTARTEVSVNSKIKSPSSTRPVFANIDVQLVPQSLFGTIATLLVGGVPIAEFYVPENVANNVGIKCADAFLLAPSEEWELKDTAGGGAEAKGLHVAYRAL